VVNNTDLRRGHWLGLRASFAHCASNDNNRKTYRN
jgi:hypothetical protein